MRLCNAVDPVAGVVHGDILALAQKRMGLRRVLRLPKSIVLCIVSIDGRLHFDLINKIPDSRPSVMNTPL